jgi:diguanylate cyclase
MNNIITKLKVLVVEDDSDDFLLLKTYLNNVKEYSFEITRVECIFDSLTMLAKHKYDLILSDLTLPDSDSYNTVETIINNSENTPLIVLTGVNEKEIITKILAKGVQDYLVKGDFDSEALEKAVYYTLERSKLVYELKILNKKLQKQSNIDSLTGIYNRRGLEIALNSKIKGVNFFYCLLLDLDDFKNINDSFGHSTGDIVLKEVASVLKMSVRDSDIVSRIGGDEFIVCLFNLDFSFVQQIAEKIKKRISNIQIQIYDSFVKCTASIGGTFINTKNFSIDSIINFTDKPLKNSKILGKNRVSFNRGDENILESSTDLAVILRQIANESKHIYPVMMPVKDIHKEEIYGYEFFIRSEISEILTPVNLFEKALQYNLITPIDYACFKTCLYSSKKIITENNFINIFPTTLISIPPEQILDDIECFGYPEKYCLEISEKQIFSNPMHLLDSVNFLKKNGVKIAIDDVGYGQTCLENLIVLRPDIIKIDESCTIGIAENTLLQENMKRFINVILALDVKNVIVEGIEVREDLEFLRKLSITKGQGFIWGKPVKCF